MAVFSGPNAVSQYRQTLMRRRKALKNVARSSTMKAARTMIMNSTKLAPIYSGETIRGIRMGRRTKEGQEVISQVRGNPVTGFKQNLWANQTGEYLAPRMRWNKMQPTVYGSGSARWSGTPGFWSRAVFLTRREFINITRKDTEKALKVI